MSPRSTLTALSFLSASSLAACGGAEPPTRRPATLAPQAADAPPAYESPARWVYFPHEVGTPTATLALERTCLVTTDVGDRWLVEGTRDKPCVGRGVASASPLFETISGIRRSAAGFEFVTTAGTVFTSADPLGAFARYARPTRPLSGAASGNRLLVGVDDLGRIQTFDTAADGTGGWKPASAPGGTRFIAVGADDKDHLVAISVPERLHFSSDQGKTFRALDAAPFGAVAVVKTPAGKMRVDGMLKSFTVDDEGRLTESRRGGVDTDGQTDVAIDASLTPTIGAIREGRADVAGDRYYEVRRAAGREDDIPFRLVRGPIAGPLENVAIEGIPECDDAKLTAKGKAIAIACAIPRESAEKGDLTIHVSLDGGNRFEALTTLRTQTFDEIRLDVDARGAVLVGGTCRLSDKKEREPARATSGKKPLPPKQCKAKGPIYVQRDAAGKTTLQAGTAPMEPGAPILSPTIGPEGRLFFGGYRKKDRRDTIFVSSDGGKTYESRVLDAPAEDVALDADEGETPLTAEPAGPTPISFVGGRLRLTIDETGAIGFAAETQNQNQWVTLDAEGRVVNAASFGKGTELIGGFGRRVVAFEFSDGGTLRAWESADGGISTAEIATTTSLINSLGADASPACDAGGCLFNDAIARIGWDGQAETPLAISEPPFVAPPVAVRDVVACELTDKNKWIKIPHALAFAGGFPRLAETFRGKSAFSILTFDPFDGSFYVTTASVDDDPQKVVTRKIVGPVRSRGEVAVFARQQIEGYAVGYAPVPLTAGSGNLDQSKPMKGIELGWVNFFTGDLARKQLDTKTSWSPASAVFLDVGDGKWAFEPGLASIVGRGLAFVPRRGEPAAYYVEGGGEARAFELPDWSALDVEEPAFSDAMYVEKQLFGVGFMQHAPSSRGILLGHKPQGATSFVLTAQTIAPLEADVGWVSVGGVPGVSIVNVDAETGTGTAEIVRLAGGKVGSPEAAPTPADLAARARPCKDEDRKRAARLAYPYFGSRGTIQFGTRRQAVVVSETTAERTLPDSLWMLSDGVVVGGTKAEPCLAGLKASGTMRGYAAVISAETDRAWLFRQTGASPPCGCAAGDVYCRCDAADRPKTPTSSGIEVRAMTCKAAAQSVPQEVTAMAPLRMPDDLP